jgi:hypothetical protein
MPMIDAIKLFQEYFYKESLPEDLLLQKSRNNKQSIKLAEQHVMGLLTNQLVHATPGQKPEHLEYEYQVIDALVFQRNEKDEEIKKDLEKQANELMRQYQKATQSVPPYNPMTGQPVQIPMPEPKPNERLVSEIDKLNEALQRLMDHVVIESMPASMRTSRIMQTRQKEQEQMMAMQAQTQPQMPQQGQMEAEMQTQMPIGSQNQISPDMINSQNPAGQVPMGMPAGIQGPMMQ